MSFKYHLVKWNLIKISKEMGGLWVRDLKALIKALLGIWPFGSTIPTEVFLFVWWAMWNKNFTIDNLQLRGWHMSIPCYVCGVEESLSQLVLQCSVA